MTNRGNVKEEIQVIIDRAVEEILAAVHRGIFATLAPSGRPWNNGSEVNINSHKKELLAAADMTNGKAKRAPILCPVAGCRQGGGGPKWGWFCKKHKDLTEKQKAAARASRGKAAE